MRRWMMAGGAAVMMAIGSAHAAEPIKNGAPAASVADPDGVSSRDGRALTGTHAPGPMDVPAADVSRYLTREEFLKYYGAVLERLARDEKAQEAPEPTFTDAG